MKTKNMWRCFITDILLPVIITYVLFGIIFGICVVSGTSMTPTLDDGALLFFSRVDNNYNRGDIVIASVPSYQNGKYLIKRIIAIEGDTVDIDFDKGNVYLNGMLLEESYCGETKLEEGVSFPVTVPPHCVFIMGDNRNVSDDSRNPLIGMVDKQHLCGKAVISLLPFKKIDNTNTEK